MDGEMGNGWRRTALPGVCPTSLRQNARRRNALCTKSSLSRAARVFAPRRSAKCRGFLIAATSSCVREWMVRACPARWPGHERVRCGSRGWTQLSGQAAPVMRSDLRAIGAGAVMQVPHFGLSGGKTLQLVLAGCDLYLLVIASALAARVKRNPRKPSEYSQSHPVKDVAARQD